MRGTTRGRWRACVDGTPSDGGWTEHTVDSSFNGARSVYVEDVDGDGDLDILGAAEADHDITWWENDGSPQDDTGGDGNSWTQHTIDGNFIVASFVAAADMDGDGDMDVLGIAGTADIVKWWENDGSGEAA